MYRLMIPLLCLVSTISAAVIQPDDPRYQSLVNLAVEEVAQGQEPTLRGVFESNVPNGDKENEYTVRLELQDPERLCEVYIIDSQPEDGSPQTAVEYSVLNKECSEPVHETVHQETVPRVCAGCLTKHDVNDPNVKVAASFALSHYNEKLGAEDRLPKVRVEEVQTQVVNGINYVMVLDLMKDGRVVKTCNTTVWVKSYANFHEVKMMKCSRGPARDGREGA